MTVRHLVEESVAALRRETPLVPQVALVLGSGLGDAARAVEEAVVVPYARIPHWAVPTVAGHRGQLVVGRLDGTPVAVLRGRLHLYEGYTPQQVTFPIRVLAGWGARVLVVTNAAGGIDPALRGGDLLLIDDHINFTGSNPLVGPNDELLGPRFPDMASAYDPALRSLAVRAAAEEGIPLHRGVYVGVLGPSYETPAELAVFRQWGAHAVGMSTVHEVIVARHAGLRVLGLAVITNVVPGPVAHEAVLDAAQGAVPRLERLVRRVVGELGP